MENLMSIKGYHAPDDGIYDYSEPFKGISSDPEARLIRRLSRTRPFVRLSDIRFLGALDYCLVTNPNGFQSNARFTRAQHSIGVGALARAYLDWTDHSPRDRVLCVAAAVLHDIGHCPFSHTLEPVFEERFGLNHHVISEKIIRGQHYFGEIPETLKEFNVDFNEVIEVLNGTDDRFDKFFSGPINFDTIEGILRSRNYLKFRNHGLTPYRVLNAAVNREMKNSKEIVDSFWNCKDEIYTLVIRSKIGVLFDALFQGAARDCINDFLPSDFFITEKEAFRKFPSLRHATQRRHWPKMIHALLPEEVQFSIRRFYVDEAGDFFRHEDSVRYRQSKRPSRLTPGNILPA